MSFFMKNNYPVKSGLRKYSFALVLLGLLLVGSSPGFSRTPSVTVNMETRKAYVEVPFTIAVVVEGFDSGTEPVPGELTASGATVSYTGVSTSSRSSISLVNGVTTQSNSISYTFRWQVIANQAGNLRFPAIMLTQGDKSVSTGDFQVAIEIPQESSDMSIELSLPERPLYVGESISGHIHWRIKRNVNNVDIQVPLFQLQDIEVETIENLPDAKGSLPIFVKGTNKRFFFTQKDDLGSSSSSSIISFPFKLRVNQPGIIRVQPISVSGQITIGNYSVDFSKAPGGKCCCQK